MKEYVLKTSRLTKSYHGKPVLDDIDIALEPGKIYGLIGQNGAGKTTLMRLTAGLTFPTEGTLSLFGEEESKNLSAQRKRIGCMIEYPSFIPYLSAKENLTYYRIIHGIPSKTLEDDLLKLVGLKDTAGKKVKDFSLGMKQRLGIAIALIGDPEFLILDEPINGLDPLGIVEIRDLLIKLCKERQMTILISSHNLPELYQVATDYIIIHRGRIKQSITLNELEEKCRHHLLIGCKEPDRAVTVLEEQLNTSKYRIMPDKTIKLYDYLDNREAVAQALFDSRIVVTEFTVQGDTLENYFISAIGGEKNA